jgi:hypothetical protein
LKTARKVKVKAEYSNFNLNFIDGVNAGIRTLSTIDFISDVIVVQQNTKYLSWNLIIDKKDTRLRENVLYVSKDLKQYLKIKRNEKFKFRFVAIESKFLVGKLSSDAFFIFYSKSAEHSDEVINYIKNVIDTMKRSKISC